MTTLVKRHVFPDAFRPGGRFQEVLLLCLINHMLGFLSLFLTDVIASLRFDLTSLVVIDSLPFVIRCRQE